MTSEYEEIFTRYPYLVLMSRKPMTWRGFLNINVNTQVEIKLKVPKYPKMKNASIHFSRQMHLIYGNDFSIKVNNILNNAPSVLLFLNQLQRTMDSIIKETTSNCISKINCLDTKILDELKEIMTIPGITVFVNRDLSIIKLIYENISVQFKQSTNGNNSWTVVLSDLPQLKTWKSFDKCITTLSDAAHLLKSRVNELASSWEVLKTIDENCWVLDPINPKPCHLYRRIYLNAALSILIVLDPLNPESFQEIKVLGSSNEVGECQNLISENIHKWSNDRSIIENLLDILNVSELPRPPTTKESEIKANTGIVSDEECCICFSLDLDNGEMPSEICDNKKCRRVFHTICLSQWLAAVVGNPIIFDRIHGNCPNCKENISAPIVNNE